VKLDIEEVGSWLDQAKVKIEQITVESASSGRISIISNGDRPQLKDMRFQVGRRQGRRWGAGIRSGAADGADGSAFADD